MMERVSGKKMKGIGGLNKRIVRIGVSAVCVLAMAVTMLPFPAMANGVEADGGGVFDK